MLNPAFHPLNTTLPSKSAELSLRKRYSKFHHDVVFDDRKDA